MTDLTVILSFLSFVLEIQVGAFGNCMDGFEGWEVGAFLQGFLELWWGWQ
jgi:hypothetical protein